MRLLATSDLHFNHPRSRQGAIELISQINSLQFDVLLLLGDTATAEGSHLEECLNLFTFRGPRLFVAGNHELWTKGGDSYELLMVQLPGRVAAAGWHWLESQPFVQGDAAIVGSVGWYDYGFTVPHLGIPKRFYEAKISPGAADRHAELAHLFEQTDDMGSVARETVARWNDGRFVHLGRSDEAFLEELLGNMERQLDSLRQAPRVLVATHHVPFAELMPPPSAPQWDFAKAFLGSPRMGELIRRYPNVQTVLAGHTHMPGEARIGGIKAIEIGGGYRTKRYVIVDV